MKRALAALLLFLAVACSHAAPLVTPTPPVNPTQLVMHSLVRISAISDDGMVGWSCTGWAIAPRKFMTAAHCTLPLAEEHARLFADGRPALVIKEDEATDLAVVVVDLDRPALEIRITPLTVGEKVLSSGYAYGWMNPITFAHVVELLNFRIEEDIYPGMIVRDGFIGGMSGGPIYDVNGKVVGMVQRSTVQVGYGVEAATILAFLKPAAPAQ